MRDAARLCGRIIEATGWTFRDLRQLSMFDVLRLVAYWREAPPLAECVRAYLGIRPVEVTAPEIDFTPRVVPEEEWKRIAEAEEKFAEVNFRRNPLA